MNDEYSSLFYIEKTLENEYSMINDDYNMLNEIYPDDIKEINRTLPDYKHIKKIRISDEPMEKTTTQKIKRYQEIKKADEV